MVINPDILIPDNEAYEIREGVDGSAEFFYHGRKTSRSVLRLSAFPHSGKHLLFIGADLGTDLDDYLKAYSRFLQKDSIIIVAEESRISLDYCRSAGLLSRLTRSEHRFIDRVEDLLSLPLDSDWTIVVLNPSSLELIPFRKRCFSLCRRLILQAKTRRSLTDPMVRNASALSSAAWITRTFPKPVECGVVISAGPSLDASMTMLRRISSRAILVATDAALRPLLKAGIHPHFTACIDSQIVSARHFTGLPETGPDTPCLLADLSLHPAVLRSWRGPIQFAPAETAFSIVAAKELGRPLLPSAGGVAEYSLSFLLGLGVSRIILVGQDLSRPFDRSHASGTTASRGLLERRIRTSSFQSGPDDPFAIRPSLYTTRQLSAICARLSTRMTVSNHVRFYYTDKTSLLSQTSARYIDPSSIRCRGRLTAFHDAPDNPARSMITATRERAEKEAAAYLSLGPASLEPNGIFLRLFDWFFPNRSPLLLNSPAGSRNAETADASHLAELLIGRYRPV